MSKEAVTIPKEEYEELKRRDLFLTALENVGVDNWIGYENAQELRDVWEGECDEQ